MNRAFVPDDGDDVEALVPLGAITDAIDAHRDHVADSVVKDMLARTMRQEPSALEAERGLIGAILLDGSRLHDARAAGLTEEDFFRPPHAIIFRAFEALDDRGEPVDVLTVTDELERTGQLDQVGGAAALAQLEALSQTTAHVEAYARIIHEKAEQRRLLQLFKTGIAMVVASRDSAAGVARYAEQQIANIRSRGVQTGFAAEVARARDELMADQVTVRRDGALEPLFRKSMADLMGEDIPDTAWLVEGLLTQSSVAATAGEPKSTKTWAATEILVSIVTGTRAFGEFFTNSRGQPVAALYSEDNRRSLRNRVRALCAGKGISERHPSLKSLRYESMRRLDIRRLDDLAFLAASIRTLPEKPVALLLDPLRNLIGDADEDSAKVMAPIMGLLHAVRNITGTAILFVHHAGKSSDNMKGRRGGQKMRGSSAIHGAIDCGLYLEDTRGDRQARWLNTVSTDVKDARNAGTFGLEFVVQDEKDAAKHAAWTFWREPKAMYDQPTTGAEEEAPRRGDDTRAKIIKVLRLTYERAAEKGRADQGMRQTEIIEATGLSRGTVWKHLGALVTDGRANRDGEVFRFRPTAEDSDQ